MTPRSEVFFWPKGGYDDRVRQPGDPAEFLARVIIHVSEPRPHLVRYYGTYSWVPPIKSRCRR